MSTAHAFGPNFRCTHCGLVSDAPGSDSECPGARANPITLHMAFERLQFETGFDVHALIAERDEAISDRDQLAAALNALLDRAGVT